MIENKEELISKIEDLHAHHLLGLNGDVPKTSPHLYHYTSLNGCLDILRSGRIRLSEAKYSNDPNEILSGLNIFCQVADRLIKVFNVKDKDFARDLAYTRFFIEKALSLVDMHADIEQRASKAFYDLGKSYQLSHSPIKVFISCFSEHQDNLRQWMPYADNGQGAALGFKGLDGHHDICADAYLLPVCYKSNSEKEKYAENLIYGFYDLFQKTSSNLMSELMWRFADCIITDIIACKSTSYEDEREWRLISVGTDEDFKDILEFKYKNSNIIVPYIELDLIKSSLLTIVLGPKVDKGLNRNSLISAAKRFDFSVEIEESKISYRG